jgi:hypothetical protein
MGAAIEAAEAQVAALEAELASPEVYKLGATVSELQVRLAKQRLEVDRLYARWQTLEGT